MNSHLSRYALALIAALSSACTAGLQDTIARSVIEGRMSDMYDPTDYPGLQAVVCGAGSPLPSREAAGPCVAVMAGGKVWIVDAGDGSAENLNLWRVPGQNIAGILLTHFHSDHIAELPDFKLQRWVGGAQTPMPIYGPEGVDEITTGYNQAYRQSHRYRIDHHGADFLEARAALLEPRSIGISATDPEGSRVVVLEEDGLRITAIKVAHAPVDPAVAYRFDYRGRSVVVSGDTIKSEALAGLARDADVLFHEALAAHIVRTMSEVATEVGRDRPARITMDILDYHATPVEAAETANDAGVRLLVYYHAVPYPFNAALESLFLRGVSDVRPDGVELGFDGLLVRLPPESTRVEIDRLED
jgi:ribonuclease Z